MHIAQIAENFAGAFEHSDAIMSPLVLIIARDEIGHSLPFFVFDRVKEILGMPFNLALRLPEPEQKQADRERDA